VTRERAEGILDGLLDSFPNDTVKLIAFPAGGTDGEKRDWGVKLTCKHGLPVERIRKIPGAMVGVDGVSLDKCRVLPGDEDGVEVHLR
jgi:hypothetical protein